MIPPRRPEPADGPLTVRSLHARLGRFVEVGEGESEVHFAVEGAGPIAIRGGCHFAGKLLLSAFPVDHIVKGGF